MDDQEFIPPAFGWSNDPQEVAATVAALEAQQGVPIGLADQAPGLVGAADDDAPVFFWWAEQKVVGKIFGPWDQGPDGQCVSFGWGRGAQDLLLGEIASGEPEEWPGAEVATEPIYAGSRVEVGGGRIRGAGSIGAWAAKWVMDWGVIPRLKFGPHDLSRYDVNRGKDWGVRGCPDDLEAEARKHPVTAVAMVTTETEGWAAIGGWKPVPVCSMQGFTTARDADGFCRPSGPWAHCMAPRGRFVHPDRGRAVVIANSWGDYLRDANRTIRYVAADGSVKTETLPGGHFACTAKAWAGMLAQRDSFAIAGFKGWEATRIDWTP
jgi:hypothetical protein